MGLCDRRYSGQIRVCPFGDAIPILLLEGGLLGMLQFPQLLLCFHFGLLGRLAAALRLGGHMT